MLTESLLLGSAAGITGIGLAYLFIRALLKLDPGNIPHMESASLDLRALAFLVIVSLATSIVFGILPALSATRINLGEFLASAGTRGLVADRRSNRRMLITAQIALVVVLLVGAGLFLHSYLNVLAVETGFSPSTIAVSVPIGPSYNTIEKRRAFYATLLQRITAQHGIDSVGLVNSLPLTDSEAYSTLWVEGYPNNDHQIVEARDITSGYLTAMQTPLVRGRNFTADEDSPAKHPLVIVNQTFVNKFFPGKDPIGLRLRTGPNLPWSTVIGVVRDIRSQSLETAAVPQIYIPFISSFPPPNGTDVAVRSSLPKAAIVSSIRAAVRSIDPGLAITNIHVMEDFATRSTAPRRFQTTLLTLFSAIALFLAVVGVYGLLAYSVRQRTGEIGLRMALGSTRAGIVRLVLREGLSILLVGLVIGMAAALLFARLLRGFLYEVPALDPLTFALVPTLLVAAVFAACLIPSARAAATDPIIALRHE
jgi:predicted permease